MSMPPSKVLVGWLSHRKASIFQETLFSAKRCKRSQCSSRCTKNVLLNETKERAKIFKKLLT